MSPTQIGKVLCSDMGYVYYIDQQMRGVIKTHPSSKGDLLHLPLSDGPICQISVQHERVYALSESGSIQVCYKRADVSLFSGKSPNSDNMRGGSGHEAEDEYDTYIMGIPPSPGLVGDPDTEALFSDEESGGRLGDEDGAGLGHQKRRMVFNSQTLVLQNTRDLHRPCGFDCT